MKASGAARGFTLIELMVTITVIAVLLILATPTFSNSVLNARERSVVQKFTQDFESLRGSAGSPGTTAVSLTLQPDCTWLANVNGAPDLSRSMTALTLASLSNGIACSSATLALPATFDFQAQGSVTPNGTLTFTGAKGQLWPLQVLFSGSIVRLKGVS